MATVTRTKLPTILPLVLARLQTVTSLPAERCFLSQRKKMPYDGHGDQYLWVRVEDDSPDSLIWQGGGRIDAREEQVLCVVARTRLELDEPGHDGSWLTNASLGHLYLVHNVLDALLGFHVTDTDGNVLTCGVIDPGKGSASEKDQAESAWGESRRYFRLTYELDLDQTYQ